MFIFFIFPYLLALFFVYLWLRLEGHILVHAGTLSPVRGLDSAYHQPFDLPDGYVHFVFHPSVSTPLAPQSCVAFTFPVIALPSTVMVGVMSPCSGQGTIRQSAVPAVVEVNCVVKPVIRATLSPVTGTRTSVCFRDSIPPGQTYPA